jgi:tetratricopeptide (TPR) repeat protein
VTYVSGRADPLAATFGFCALALGLVSLERRSRAGLATIAAACCFFAALLSKESGVTALLVWFLILAWRRERFALFARWVSIAVGVLAIYGVLRFGAEKVDPPHGAPSALASRPILIARACAEYAGLLALPTNLRMERDVASTDPGARSATVGSIPLRDLQTALGFLLILSLVAWWLWARRRAPIAAFALLAFLTAYIPISNLFPLNATVAEHWLYVPSAFLFLAIIASLQALQRRYPKFAWCSVLLLTALAGYYGKRTHERQRDWLDQRTFLTRTIQAGGDSARMRVNLGQLESAENRNEEALSQFRIALEKEPNLSFALLGMAALHVRLGHYDEARDFLARAEQHPEIAPDARQVRVALEYRESGRDTTDLLREAADLAPLSWPPRKRYLSALDEQGKTVAAVQGLRKFLERQPFRAESWRMLGELLEKLGDREHAVPAFEEACELDVWDATSRRALERLRGAGI